MGHGHRHADLLDYSLAQMRGYARAHRAHEARALAQRMDAQRVAVNADADGYTSYRDDLLAAVRHGQREPAWKSAWRRFAAEGALPQVDEALDAGFVPGK